ncbi:NUDIX domain-containing protein [Arthrobacter sp. NyZ413]|uniref:NUDIX domain-containing protein n=1 Tax=Arthrobacter sp. NyZ413 TaxID=3144669 RepID=UPI003BF83AF1
MSITHAPDVTACANTTAPAAPQEVVAVILEHHGRIALLKRSKTVGHDQNRWHCVTGYLEPGASPEQQALMELHEEAGLGPMELSCLESRASLALTDPTGRPWLVHTFKAVTSRRRLRLNEEHVSYRWTHPAKVSRFSNRVDWLGLVLDAAL